MMYNYIIPIVIVLLIFVVVLFVYRKKHHTEISRLDQKRLDLQNKPVLEELSKVKKLNMSGQAEEMFERWRNKWTDMMDDDLVQIEQQLIQAEETVDKFQFKKATQIEEEVEQRIDACDGELENILTELNDLIESEKKSRVEIENLKLDYRTSRKTLLAHQYSFGEAGNLLESRLAVFPEKFEAYERLTAEGNYLEAKEIVKELDHEGKEILRLITEIPTLLTDVQHKIPNDLFDLRNGYRSMEQQSFFLLHLELPEKLDAIEAQLPILKEQLVQLETEDAIEQVEQMKKDIDAYYEALENEVHAKQFVDSNFAKLGTRLEDLLLAVDEMQYEAEVVQKSYHLTTQELAMPRQCRSALNTYKQRYDLLCVEVKEEQSAYSILKEELEDLDKLIEIKKKEIEEFSKKLVDLRVHENEGREQLESFEQRLRLLERKIQKANMPGIPDEIIARFKEADQQLDVVKQELLEVPINVGVIAANLKKSNELITEAEGVIEEMLSNVQLIELLIQYGNRYRTSKTGMDEKLTEAELAFTNLRYTKALEVVATAVEAAEPGALKRIEGLAKQTVTRV